MNELPLHPLINPNSPHYDGDNRKSAIEELEEVMTVYKMIGACEFNIFKYEYRKERKGVKEEDEYKIKTYRDYRQLLIDLEYLDLGFFTVQKALQMTQREFRYR